MADGTERKRTTPAADSGISLDDRNDLPGRPRAFTAAGLLSEPGQSPQAVAETHPLVEQFSLHGQGTAINQKHDIFRATFTGVEDVPQHEPFQTSVTGTLFVGGPPAVGGR
jgi:hypothetical protein